MARRSAAATPATQPGTAVALRVDQNHADGEPDEHPRLHERRMRVLKGPRCGKGGIANLRAFAWLSSHMVVNIRRSRAAAQRCGGM